MLYTSSFAKFGGHPNPIVGLFTGDEEIGSPSLKRLLSQRRKKRVWLSIVNLAGQVEILLPDAKVVFFVTAMLRALLLIQVVFMKMAECH